MKSEVVSRIRLIVSGFVLVGCAAALATESPSQGTPGWKYGGNNCGCGPNGPAQPTLVSCRQCCIDAGVEGLIEPADVSDCQAFCNQATFPCI